MTELGGFLAGVDPTVIDQAVPEVLTEPRGHVLPCDDPQTTWLGYGLCRDAQGLIVYGWYQRRVDDVYEIRYGYNGVLCAEPNTFPIEQFGDAMRRALSLNREEASLRATMPRGDW